MENTIFKITVEHEGKKFSKSLDLKKEKETIDEIYKMAEQISNEIYSEQCEMEQRSYYEASRGVKTI